MITSLLTFKTLLNFLTSVEPSLAFSLFAKYGLKSTWAYPKVNREYKELRRKNIGKAVPANEVNDILERKKRLEEDLSGWKLHSQIIENFINEVNICEYNDCMEVENDLSK